jgi:hypothetical protein
LNEPEPSSIRVRSAKIVSVIIAMSCASFL